MSIVEKTLQKSKVAQGGALERTSVGTAAAAQVAANPRVPVADAGALVSHRGPLLHVDLERLRELRVAFPEAGSRRRAYEYRTIKFSLSRRSRDEDDQDRWRLIAVTSALPNDGKTCTSFNLAVSFAQEEDRPVVLVDADIAKRHLSEVLDVLDRPGLANLIKDPRLDLQDAIMPTDVPGLSFLPAGDYDSQGGELLGSSRLASVIESLERAHPNHVFIFDTSPLLLTSEASLLAPLVGQLLLVVRAGVTPQDAAREALARVKDLTRVSVVLNAWQPVGLAEKDYYGRYQDYYGK